MRARSISKDGGGKQVALVSCDLFAVPESLRFAAARIYNTETPKNPKVSPLPPLVPERIIVAATHTHQGPGNFLASAVQNMFGSPYSGFDRELFEHLAHGVASGDRPCRPRREEPRRRASDRPRLLRRGIRRRAGVLSPEPRTRRPST